MINERFKSRSNEVLNELIELGYYLTKPFTIDSNEHNGEVWVYMTPTGGGLEYKFTVEIGSRKKSVEFNGNNYDNAESLLKAVDAWANGLMFPTNCYDPSYNKRYCTELKVHHVLNHIYGYEYNAESFSMNSFVRRNSFGEVVSTLYLKYNEDGSGQICKTYSRNTTSFTEVPFKDGEEAASIINSLLLIEASANMDDFITIVKNIDVNNIGSMKDAKTVDTTNFLNVKITDYKDEVLPKLEELVKKLKEL